MINMHIILIKLCYYFNIYDIFINFLQILSVILTIIAFPVFYNTNTKNVKRARTKSFSLFFNIILSL